MRIILFGSWGLGTAWIADRRFVDSAGVPLNAVIWSTENRNSWRAVAPAVSIRDIGEEAGAVGEEGLVDFVGRSDEKCGHDGEGVAGENVAQAGTITHGEPEAAVADEREDAVPGEVADFADGVVGEGPSHVDGVADEETHTGFEWSGGVIGAKRGSGLSDEDEGKEEYGRPGLQDGPMIDSFRGRGQMGSIGSMSCAYGGG